MTDDALRAARERIVRAHIDAERRGDVAGALATFAEASYDVPALGMPIEGPEAVAEYLSGLFTAFPDLDVEVRSLHHADDIVYVDTVLQGTQHGPFVGLPPSGLPVAFRCGCVFHFDGTRLVRETVHFDSATVMRQLGVLPAQGSRADRVLLTVAGVGIRAKRALRR